MKTCRCVLLCALSLSAPLSPTVAAAQSRVRDLVSVEGVRDNQLVGYGLVVGLNGTGDKRQTIFSAQSLANMLARVGVTVPATAFQVRNTAAVVVTATLPPYAQSGGRIDITVGAIGDASNLQGGILVQTSLRGADGAVYAAAQGPVVTGGFAAGRGGNSQTLNHPTVGRIAGGALVEKASPTPTLDPELIRLQLHKADPEVATKLVGAINSSFQGEVAKALHPGLIALAVPPEYRSKRVEFLGRVESLAVSPNAAAKIIINERTGTIVMGKDVPISPVSILHGALTVEVQTRYDVSQPAPFGGGQTTVVPEQRVQTKEERAKNVTLRDGATVEDLVRGLQSIGATARDVIAILDAIRAAGALQAELEVI